jgi:hypothetical protein
VNAELRGGLHMAEPPKRLGDDLAQRLIEFAARPF